jgi:hypothetical protein
MRGPLESLIAQAQQEQFKKRFPHRFLPSSGARSKVHAVCQSVRLWRKMSASAQMALNNAVIA